MPKSKQRVPKLLADKYQPRDVGNYQRRYDSLSEEEGNDEEQNLLAEVLKWMEGGVPSGKKASKKGSSELKELFAAGLELEQVDKIAALHALKEAKFKTPLLKRLGSAAVDFYHAARDILAGNRIKTSATILGSIAAGAAIGAVLGTLVFPGIGSAVGGAVGAFISGALGLLGGGVGLGILGAFAGSWVGRKISNKVFKDEKHYELSKRITKHIKKKIGIQEDVTQLIHGYLYNRQQKIRSPLCKRYYKLLRNAAIKHGDALAMDNVAKFFCQELILLKREIEPGEKNPGLQKDLNTVLYILENLRVAHGISPQIKQKISRSIRDFYRNSDSAPILAEHRAAVLPQHKQDKQKDRALSEAVPLSSAALPVVSPSVAPVPAKVSSSSVISSLVPAPVLAPREGPGIRVVSAQPPFPAAWEAVKEQFMKACREGGYGVKDIQVKTTVSEKMQEYRYQITLNNDEKLPEIIARQKQEKDQHVIEIVVDKNQLTKSNQDKVAELIVEHAKVSLKEMPGAQMIVCAAGNDEMAILLYAKALKKGLQPTLDESEYPANTPEALAKRQKITQEAYRAAGLPPPTPPTTIKFGLVK